MSDESGESLNRRGFLRRGTVTIGISALLIGFGSQYDTGVDAPTPTPTPTPEAMTPFDASEYDRIPDVTPIEREIHRLTNEAREKHGRDSVKWHGGLAYVARDHSRDMNDRNFINHVNPDGEKPWDRTARYGVDLTQISENISYVNIPNIDEYTIEEIAKEPFKGWKTSEKGHWENILDEEHTHEGVGVYLTENGVIATQLFGRKP